MGDACYHLDVPLARRAKRQTKRPNAQGSTVVIDNGSHELRAGFCDDSAPCLRFPNRLIRPRARWSTDFETVVGESHFNVKGFDFGRAAVRSPFDANVVVNFDTQEAILDYTFDRLGFKESMECCGLVMTECLLNPVYCRKTMSQLLFEGYGLSHVAFVPDALAAFHFNQNSRRCPSSAVLVHSGHSATHVVPIVNGQAHLLYAQRSKICGSQATAHLQQLLTIHNPQCAASVNRHIVELLKEQCTFCSLDYMRDVSIAGDWKSSEGLGLKVQLPKSVAGAGTNTGSSCVQESSSNKDVDKAMKAEEQRMRLKAMSLKRKQKMITEKEELLIYLRDIEQQISVAQDEDVISELLEDAEVSSKEGLQKYIDATMASLQRLKQPEPPTAQASTTETADQAPEDIDVLRERYCAIRERLDHRKRSRLSHEGASGPSSKRISSAQRRRMKLVAEAAAQDDEDDFGADDKDWDVYKEMDTSTSSTAELNRQDEAELKELREKLQQLGDDIGEMHSVEIGHPQLMGQLDENHVYLSVERLRIPELLFQPSLMGIDQAGIPEIVAHVLKSLPADLVPQVDENLLLCGGNAAYKGLDARLGAEMCSLRPFGRPMKVICAQDFFLDAWKGAAQLATSDIALPFDISSAEYQEFGSGIVERKRIPFVHYAADPSLDNDPNCRHQSCYLPISLNGRDELFSKLKRVRGAAMHPVAMDCMSKWLFWSLFLLFRSIAASNGWPLAEPDYSIYHRQFCSTLDVPLLFTVLCFRETLLQSVKDIVERHPTFMKMEEMQHSVHDYSVSLPIVTLEPGGWASDDNKIRILMSFGEHGREFISSELGLRLLECFDGPAQLRTCIRNTTQYDITESILRRTVFKIIPIENPRGREKVENGSFCERKNGRGVDINRNWNIDFGVKESDYDPREEYAGEFAFSEPETVVLRDLASGFAPHVWVAVHSGMCAVFMPYDHVGVMPEGKSAEAQLKILQTLKDENLPEGCVCGPGGKTVGYVAHGTGTDYMYSVLHVPLAFTWEIYGDTSARYEDCFRLFNPLTSDGVQTTLSVWTATFFNFIQLLPDHPDIPDVRVIQDEINQDDSPENLETEKLTIMGVKAEDGIHGASHTVISSFETTHQERSYELNLTPLLIGLTPLILGMIVVVRLFAGRPRYYRNRGLPT